MLMRTVIVRLSAPSGDGKLHGLVEVVGTNTSMAFANDDQLLAMLHSADETPEHQRSGIGPERTE
jgi:hypothetical protein